MLTNICNLKALTRQIDMFTVWEDCHAFLVREHNFIPESNLFYLKDNQVMLVELFRLYYMHHVNTQLNRLSTLSRQYAASADNQLHPRGSAEADRVSEESDYNEDEFSDLRSSAQVQKSIRLFTDRLKELINPIDPQRLDLDSVAQVKEVVAEFYARKSQKCQQLLWELDKRQDDRPNILRLKKGLIRTHETGSMKSVRLEADYERVGRLKRVLEQSGWYYALIKRMITEEIHKKPLAQFMSGKCFALICVQTK